MAGSGDEGGESLEGVLEELIADAGLEGVVASALRSDFASSPLRKKLNTIRELEDMRKGKEAATAGGSGRTEKHREASAASDTGMRIYEPSKMRATRPITGYQGKQEELSTNAKLGSQNGPLNFITTNEDDLDLDDLNTSWKSLLEETMSDPHKRRVLQESFDREKSKVRKYHMLLEFSSYLRKPDASPSLSEGAKAGLRRRRRPGSNSANGRSSDSGREGVLRRLHLSASKSTRTLTQATRHRLRALCSLRLPSLSSSSAAQCMHSPDSSTTTGTIPLCETCKRHVSRQ